MRYINPRFTYLLTYTGARSIIISAAGNCV